MPVAKSAVVSGPAEERVPLAKSPIVRAAAVNEPDTPAANVPQALVSCGRTRSPAAKSPC
jgi:hypothetical protein